VHRKFKYLQQELFSSVFFPISGFLD